MSKTVAQLRTEIIDQLWPSGAPENLITAPREGAQSPYAMNLVATLAEISKWVPGEQVNHTDVIPFCATWYKCGQTIVSCPVGLIHRVGTILTGDYCSPVWYNEVDWPAPEWFGQKLAQEYGDLITPAGSSLPLGISKADEGTDTTYRAEAGIWCKQRKNIHLSPWLNSAESIVIEWDGIKHTWADTDLVTETPEYSKAVLLYFQYLHEYHYGSMQKALTIHNPSKAGVFDEALADLIWQDRENTRRRESKLDPNTIDSYVVQEAATTETAPAEEYVEVTDTVTGKTYHIQIVDGQIQLVEVA